MLVFAGSLCIGVAIGSAVVKTCSGSGTCNGTSSGDKITGNSQVNNIQAFGAGDNVFGKQGSDTINGGDQADHLEGNPNNDTIYGGNGNDHIDYNAYNSLYAGMWGGNGNDRMYGNAGFDYLVGESGADTIVGGPSNDLLWAFDCEKDVVDGGSGVTDRCYLDYIDRHTACDEVTRFAC